MDRVPAAKPNFGTKEHNLDKGKRNTSLCDRNFFSIQDGYQPSYSDCSNGACEDGEIHHNLSFFNILVLVSFYFDKMLD